MQSITKAELKTVAIGDAPVGAPVVVDVHVPTVVQVVVLALVKVGAKGPVCNLAVVPALVVVVDIVTKP